MVLLSGDGYVGTTLTAHDRTRKSQLGAQVQGQIPHWGWTQRKGFQSKSPCSREEEGERELV